ncbi:RNA repair transcriptional activator RtcR family protein [Escherichia coli]
MLDLSRYNAIASRFAEERQQTLDFLKSGIATRNPHFNRMIEQIEKVAIKSARRFCLTVQPARASHFWRDASSS